MACRELRGSPRIVVRESEVSSGTFREGLGIYVTQHPVNLHG